MPFLDAGRHTGLTSEAIHLFKRGALVAQESVHGNGKMCQVRPQRVEVSCQVLEEL
jgi:hypothetical protein